MNREEFLDNFEKHLRIVKKDSITDFKFLGDSLLRNLNDFSNVGRGLLCPFIDSMTNLTRERLGFSYIGSGPHKVSYSKQAKYFGVHGSKHSKNSHKNIAKQMLAVYNKVAGKKKK